MSKIFSHSEKHIGTVHLKVKTVFQDIFMSRNLRQRKETSWKTGKIINQKQAKLPGQCQTLSLVYLLVRQHHIVIISRFFVAFHCQYTLFLITFFQGKKNTTVVCLLACNFSTWIVRS